MGFGVVEDYYATGHGKHFRASGVTIDYLVKDAEYQNIDNETLKRMKELERLSKEDKGHVFAMLDAFFAKAKLQSIL